MNRRLLLSDERDVHELALWFRAHRDELLARLGVPARARDENRVHHQASHSMDHGRDAPAMRPTSERDGTSLHDDDVLWEVTTDVALWNPREVATASIVVHAATAAGARVRVQRYVRDTARVDALDVELRGVADPEGLFAWLVGALDGAHDEPSALERAPAPGEPRGS